jgi:hypothetical protein
MTNYRNLLGTTGTLISFSLFAIVPHFFNILPMYMLFVAAGPLVVWGLARRPFATLAVSLAVYSASQFGLFAFLILDLKDRLYFDPIPWQILFVMGIAVRRLPFEIPRTRWLLFTALSVLLLVAARKALVPALTRMQILPDNPLWEVPTEWAEKYRPALPFVRLLYFIVFAYVGAVIAPLTSGFWTTRLAGWFKRLGRHSLLVFCAGILITWISDAVIARLRGNWAHALLAVGCGALLSWGIAWMADHIKLRAHLVSVIPRPLGG